tara:strand:+ start:395 stop:1108 length:714 start_codon:yes stop_codon:yes gene_type:complete
MRNNNLVQINEGEYYLFFNFYKGKKNITLGYPYKNSKRNNVYLNINGVEEGRISYNDANFFLSKSILSVLPIHRIKGINPCKVLSTPKQISVSIECKLCEKQLRGNLTKVICSECFNRLGRPEIKNLDGFQKLNKTYFETLELALSDYSIDEISIEREKGFATILNHLEKLSGFVNFKNCQNLEPSQIIIEKIKIVIKQIGKDNSIREFYDRLNLESFEEISFNEIKHGLFYIDHVF